MNAITDIVPVAGTDWNKIYDEVNAWRGLCLHHISLTEMAVTETLLRLEAVKPDGALIHLRQLIGQRFEDLGKAIGPEGIFADKGQHAFAALLQYRERQTILRDQLCHGTIKVAVQPSGKWLITIRSISIRSRQVDRGLIVLDQSEATAKLNDLKDDSQKLSASLGNLRNSVLLK